MDAQTIYKTIRTISNEEKVTELAIWETIQKGVVKSMIQNGVVVISNKDWDSYAESPAGKRYLNYRREFGKEYYVEMAKLNEVEQ